MFRVLLQASVHKVFERFAEVTSELGRRIFGNEEESSHWMYVSVGWFALAHLNGCNAQAPDVGLDI